ncbi:MAG: PAS domain S-box protein [Stygiobacter sp.]
MSKKKLNIKKVKSSTKKSKNAVAPKTTKKKSTDKTTASKILKKLKKEIKLKESFQEKLIENEERYRIISQITSDYMFAASFDKKYISLDWYSKSFEQDIGYPLENIFNLKYIRRYFYPDDLKSIIPIRNKLIKGEIVEREVRIFNSNGEIVWINAKVFPLYDKKKKRVTKFYCAAQNITRRKKAEIELKELNYELELRIQERTSQLENAVKNLQQEIEYRTETEKKLLETQKQLKELIEGLDKKLQESEYKHLWNVFETSEIPTFTFLKDGTILNYNKAIENLTGYTQDELKTITKFAEFLLESENKSEFFKSVYELNNSEIKNINKECTIITKQKKKKEIFGLISKLLHEGNDTGIVIVQFLDISEQKRISGIINTITESISSKTGQYFFDSLVEEIAKSIEADYVLIGVSDEKNKNLINTISVYGEGKLLTNFSYYLESTPCQDVFGKNLCVYNENCFSLFPKDQMLKDLEIEAYAGMPLIDKNNNPNGILVALKKSPFENVEFVKKILTIYGSRASSEIEINNTFERLKESENKFSKAFYTSPDAININRLKDGLYIDVNDGFCNLTGWSKNEVIGRTSAEINIWYDLKDRKKLINELLSKGYCENLFATFRIKNGELRQCLMSASIIEINNEKCILSITRDITELKQKEKLLTESEERFRILMEVSPYSHLVHLDGIVLYANQATVKMFKAASLNDVIGNNLFNYIHPRYKPYGIRKLEQIKNGIEKNGALELKYICFDGSVIDVEVYARQINYKNQNAILVVANDITEKRKAKQKLKESEQRFKKLFEFSPEALYLVENDKIILANKAFLNLVGAKTFNEVKDKNINDFVHPDYKKLYITRKEALKNADEILPFVENKLIKLDGSIVYAEISSVEITFEGRTVSQSVARNITEKIEINNALKESQERFKIIVENSPYAYVIHQNGKLVYANPATLKMINAHSLDEIIGKPIIDFVHPDYRKIAIERIKQGAKNLKPLPPLEEKLFTLDGKEFIAEVSSIPFYLNGALAYQLIINDITNIKKANEQLLKLSKAVEFSSTGVVITDKNGKIEYVNKKFEQITGYTSDEVIGNTPRVIKSGKQNLEFYKNLWDIILKGENFSSIIVNKRKNGELYWELNSISSIKDNDGNITHFVAIKEDVTEQKLIEQQLLKAKEEAEEAAKVRTHLLANLSHEFRTPLGSIVGYSSLLKSDTEDEEVKKIATQIELSGKRLLKIFNELLTLTELETDEFAINHNELDLPLFCSQLKILYETLASSKGIEIKTNLLTEELTVYTDENILTKILSYIIDNAIKFTENGQVIIQLDKPIEKENYKYAVIKVIDTGRGIKNEELEIIFKEFRQISEGIRRDFEGLGLGLTLASRLAKLINAEIQVESEFNKGSIFSIVIPIKNDTPKDNFFDYPIKSDDKKQNEIKPINILIVEDNPLNMDIIHRTLIKFGEIHSARDGISAIKLAKENNFDIMLIDINLGYGMDGIEVLNQIRKFEHHKNTSAIALTAYATNMSKKEFIQKGFNEYIAKPFEKKALIDLVIKLTQK